MSKSQKKKTTNGTITKKMPSGATGKRPTVGRDDIALRAYSIYLSGQGGSELDHWLQAERELLSPKEATHR